MNILKYVDIFLEGYGVGVREERRLSKTSQASNSLSFFTNFDNLFLMPFFLRWQYIYYGCHHNL